MFLVKKSVPLITFILLFFSISVFASGDAVNTGHFNSIAIKGYDTVAYFTQNKAVKGDKIFRVKWHDAYWHFSSQENKELFEADPDKYAPQYGGWCAVAMSDEGNTSPIDPEAFDIYEGKLYLNYDKTVQGFWLEDKINFINKADHFYPIKTNVNNLIKQRIEKNNKL